MSMMNYRENRSEIEYKLIVITKLPNARISSEEHTIIVQNMLRPQLKDLMAAINEILPSLKREQCSLYCRYGDLELYPILDHMTMIAAFTLMNAHESPLIYLIRKDVGEWQNDPPNLMKNPADVKLICEADYPERWSTEYRRGRPEHIPDNGLEAIRVATVKKEKRISTGASSQISSKKSVNSQVGRKSMKRQSKVQSKSMKGKGSRNT